MMLEFLFSSKSILSDKLRLFNKKYIKYIEYIEKLFIDQLIDLIYSVYNTE
jgi:hypothetical protein